MIKKRVCEGVMGEAFFPIHTLVEMRYELVFHLVYPHFPQVYLSPWSAINVPGPHRGQSGFFRSTVSPFITYKSLAFMGYLQKSILS